MDPILIYPIALPMLAGLLCLILPKRVKVLREWIALIVSAASVGFGVYIFAAPSLRFNVEWLTLGANLSISFDLLATPFARLVVVAASIFAMLAAVYSLKYMADHARHGEYYAYLLMALGAAVGTALANNFIVLLIFWELLGLFLYLMVTLSGDEAIPSATKTFLIGGMGDLSLLMGMVLLWLHSGTLTIGDIAASPQALNGPLPAAAFGLMLIGAFAKAGVVPLHTWIPAIATRAPLPVMAYFTALDKLVGIYFLARITIDLFVMTEVVGAFLMILGAITILAGVAMALIQHDYRRMLAFHSVSQVGYMVLGIGTGTPVGVIGGLFHMLNMVILKGNLFLCGGSVQRQTGRAAFEDLGGLARAMPWTFAASLIAALGISGVPPLNAFVSKWLIYQGILDRGGALFPIILAAAMFGSAMTLASFMKFLYSMFWGDRPKGLERVTESGASIVFPMIVLTLVTIGFGVFYTWPVDALIRPILGLAGIEATIPGLWQSGLATALLLVSLLIGGLVYWIGRPRESRETDAFIGGEALDPQVYRVPGTHFYGPIKEMRGLKQMFALAERGAFDIYRYGAAAINRAAQLIYKNIDQALGDFYQQVIPDLLSIAGRLLRLLNARLIMTHALWLLYGLGIIGALTLPQDQYVLNATRVVACVGMLGWAILAWVEIDLRRLLVLAATSQLGFAVLGITLSHEVALSYLVTTSIAVAVLGLSGWSIARSLRTSQIDAMNGLAGRMPLRFTVFLIAALWLTGLPPFGSFFSKYMLGVAAHEISPFLSIIITATAILTLGYFLRPIRRFLRPAR